MHRCHVDAHTSKSDVTCPCALGSRRAEAVKHVWARARARFLRTHGHLPSLTASHTETLWLSMWQRVLGGLEAANVFSAWGSEGKKTSLIFPLNFQYVALYITSIYSVNQLSPMSIICKKFKIFRVLYITWFIRRIRKQQAWWSRRSERLECWTSRVWAPIFFQHFFFFNSK